MSLTKYATFLILILLYGISSCFNSPKETHDLLIYNGNIIDLESGKIASQHILISAGRIQKLIDVEMLPNYEAKDTLDATGKYILPGFWDNHVHFRGGDSLIGANRDFLKLFIANGITTVRDAGGDLTPSVMQWKREISNGTQIGPTIFTSGPKIDGPNPTWAGSLPVSTKADISFALDSLQRIPSDFVKLYDSRITGELYLETIHEAEKRGLITSGHMPFTVTLDATIDAGIDAIEHLYYIMKGSSSKENEITAQLVDGSIGFWQAMPALQETYSDAVAEETFQKLRTNNVYVVPTLHIGKTLSYLDEVDHSQDLYLNYMGSGIIKTYEGRIKRALLSSEKAREDRKALDAFFGKLAHSLYENGVGLLAGSDSGAFNSYTYPGISLHFEMQEMVANGIPALEALKTSAYNGAQFLKQGKDYGLIAENKVSDLVILDKNPLENIEHTRSIYAVVKKDQVYSQEALKQLLKSIEK